MNRVKTRKRAGGTRITLVLLAAVFSVAGVAFAASMDRAKPSPAGDPLASNSPFSRSLSISVTPAEQSVDPGGSARYMVQLRNRTRRKVSLAILDGLPAGATASYGRTRFGATTRKSSSAFTVDTAGASTGGHRIRLIARSGRRRAIAAVNLVIASRQPSNFSIAGDLSMEMEPGLTLPLDLVLTNPGPVGLVISDLTVSVARVEAPRATASLPCTVDDFSVAQFSGAYGFVLPASTTRSLGQFGLPAESWPQVTMLDTDLNQDGCKASRFEFDFTGTAGSV